LSKHLCPLLKWLQQHPTLARSGLPGSPGAPKHNLGREFATLFDDYFEQRRVRMRGQGYGFVLTHRAQIVTRRHLIWLEQQGHLPAETAACQTNIRIAEPDHGPLQAVLEHFVAKVDPQLPERLRRPSIQYLEHLVYERELVRSSIKSILRTNLALCRHLADAGHDGFLRLRAAQLDQVVGSLLSAPGDDLLRRRRQVQSHHSQEVRLAPG
jgi:hypothetical protein